MNKIITELGGRRIWFPDYKDLYLWERNEKIQNLYRKDVTGDNAEELGIRFHCCAVHIRRVVRGDDV
jgi:Mor family transcriptional regulator